MGRFDDDYNGVLLEDINHKLDAIIEGEKSLAAISNNLNNVDARLIRVETTLNVTVKTVLKDHEKLMQEHKEQFRDHKKLLREHQSLLDNHDRRLARLSPSAQ